MKKKIIALGDTHGRTDWKQIVSQNEDADSIIFIGDYFDTHEDVSPDQQKENFKDLIAYKRANMEKVILLFGNHDYHYLRTTNETYSGYQQWQKTDIAELLHEALDADLLKMCHVEGNILFVHAGVTKTWCEHNLLNEDAPIDDLINTLFKYKPNAFRFTVGVNRNNYGDDITQSPIWVRPKSLYIDKIPNFTQVVGHTTQDFISGLNGSSRKIYTGGKTVETSGVVFIDTLGTSGEYLQIIDGVMSAVKLKK